MTMKSFKQMRALLNTILRPSSLKRTIFFSVLDSLLIAFSLYICFLIRFDFVIPRDYQIRFIMALPLFLTVKLVTFFTFRLYRITWRHVGINDLWNLVQALIVSQTIL